QQFEHREEPAVLLAQKRWIPQASFFETRTNARRQLLRRKRDDVVLIEPVELLRIEDRTAAADSRQVEDFGEFLAREQLAIAATRRPPEEREKIQHRFRQISLTRVFHHRRGAMTLAEPFLVGPENQRHVCKRRH